MANYAALISSLSISGSRLSDGEPNASGTVWFFEPGGNTPVNVYTDAEASAIVTQPVTLTDGGKLNTTDFPDGIFATQPVRILIQDSDGSDVSDLIYIPATAGNVGVSNDGFTDSTLDEVLTDAFTSVGGTDWKYKESAGATARTIKAKFSEIWISVKDFGAVGDGVAIDTTAIQAAVSRVKALGGGVVYFPPGTYLIDQAITLTSGSGVKFLGCGIATTVVKSSHATANAFTVTSSTDIVFEGMTVSHSSTSTGSAFSMTSVTDLTIVRCKTLHTTVPTNGYRYGLNAASCSYVSLYDNQFGANSGDVADRVLLLTDTPRIAIVNGQYTAPSGTYGSELTGSTARFTAAGPTLVQAVRFAAALTGTWFTFVGCVMAQISVATATDPRVRTLNCDQDGTTVNVTSGSTVTPDRTAGPELRIRGTTTGAAYIIAAPTPPPPAGYRDVVFVIHFYNNTGGAVTGWTMNAAYHLTAAISTVDTEHTMLTLRWDADSSVWREAARAVTT